MSSEPVRTPPLRNAPSAKRRDNFSRTTARTLAQRVGYRCSRCDADTVGPGLKADATVSVGVAAHVCAAAQGGPRFDAGMSPEERAGIDNGIWLCSNCSRIVDADPIAFPPAALRDMRAKSEAAASQRLGRTPTQFATPTIHRGSVLQACSLANPLTEIASMFRQVEAQIHAIDSRFDAHAQWANEALVVALRPNAPVDLRFNASANDVEWHQAMRDLRDFGKPFRLTRDSFKIEGSRLFDQAFFGEGPFTVSGHSEPWELLVRIEFPGGESHPLPYEIDLRGTATAGQRGFRFSAEASNGLFSLSGDCVVDDADPTVTCELEYAPILFAGRPVSVIPGVAELREAFLRFRDQREGRATFWIKDRQILNSVVDLGPGGSILDTWFTHISYLALVRSIAKYLAVQVVFQPDYQFSLKEYRDVAAVDAMCAGATDRSGPVTCEVKIAGYDKDAERTLSQSRSGYVLRFVMSTGTVSLYGQIVELPKRRTEVGPVVLSRIRHLNKRQKRSLAIRWVGDDSTVTRQTFEGPNAIELSVLKTSPVPPMLVEFLGSAVQ